MIKILIISFSNLKSDPRVYRQLLFLSTQAHYTVSAAGFGNPELQGIEYINISQSNSKSLLKRTKNAIDLKLKKFDNYYWNSPEVNDAFTKLKDHQCDLIIANDSDTLPLAIKLANQNKAKLIFDAHEYEPRHFDDRWLFRFFFQQYRDYLFQQYLPKTDAMITVCQGIADEYHHVYGANPVVITNAPFYENLSPSLTDSSAIRMIHHGGVNPSRKSENMIYLMNFLDERFTLDFMCVPNQPKYLAKLKKLAENNPRINFREPVSMLDIARITNEYDIGLYLLSPKSFNQQMALPNKLFEFIQARLAIAIWPNPEMARIVRDYDLGVIAEDFEPQSLAKKIMALDYQKINYYKQQSHQAAYELSAERNKQILLDLVQTTLT